MNFDMGKIYMMITTAVVLNPCGKLPDTFALDLSDYPSTEHFHDSAEYVEYSEDIYVGYRYFETLPGAAERVCYPFGFGLSYTSFSLETVSAGEENGTVRVCVRVTNTGERAGKEVVQLYHCPPWGLLQKPLRNLAAFRKTRLLAPGESETLTLSFPVEAMASFDDLGLVARQFGIIEFLKLVQRQPASCYKGEVIVYRLIVYT